MVRYPSDTAWTKREYGEGDGKGLPDYVAGKCVGPLVPQGSSASVPMALVWQPVRDVRPGGTILYHEALVRFPETDGWDTAPHATLAMIERCGGSLSFDRLIVRRVIDMLQSNPLKVLGVNISATSTDPDGWEDVLHLLRNSHEIASRLIVEITETAPFADLDRSARFCSHLQSCGVRIALDDFGVGHSSVATALALKPAIIKIDGSFVRQACTSAAAMSLFWHLVGVTKSLGALTIVEGVESREQATIAEEAGSIWQQGFFHGRPMTLPFAETHPDFFEGIGATHHAFQAFTTRAGAFIPTVWK
ncbi:EAL domain-containing protein (putative c-di-GMP-specific phosphodiesterase class I) [Sphingomonas sp. SORGH_AS 950]|uniref:EAL domain-containing protein n=1 Tax=Sphingomonas sp. SORGH_AS_0950 TaxID=3041792 RepID=UPI0027853666|nr:EAL domain-containing protein [Sphingomonas sp. SORGH_AS_0950]MDQ1155770.1 EAL domain-containing protein (putative c-di-GMP-specific phosphodiesterase class I) [Sphingomonas sp. SORGH_AS_0950]